MELGEHHQVVDPRARAGGMGRRLPGRLDATVDALLKRVLDGREDGRQDEECHDDREVRALSRDGDEEPLKQRDRCRVEAREDRRQEHVHDGLVDDEVDVV
ncbi:MAG TPA: hypothetical protein VGR87_05630 [Candidatus Limnocylindria bacterium]|jgi:hypothetical protein|nr:hypothetical protein [Candidatus Limnocylindria bacterium]